MPVALLPLLVSTATLWGWLGLAAILLATGQIAVWIIESLYRAWAVRARFQLEQRKLEWEVAAARARCELEQSKHLGWVGWKKLQVQWVRAEAEDSVSIYLTHPEGKPLPGYSPGQFLTLALAIPGQPKPVVRCYSLSDRYRPEHYRITVKLVSGRSASAERLGLASEYLTRALEPGEWIDCKVPAGSFVLDPDNPTPGVLLAGGIGITPLMAMVASAAAHPVQRPLTLFYVVRNGRQHVFRRELDAVRLQFPALKVFVLYSQPNAEDVLGRDYSKAGRLRAADVLRQLPKQPHDFYLCGPGSFLQELTRELQERGVEASRIHSEAFHAAAPAAALPADTAVTCQQASSSQTQPSSVEVQFKKSGITVPWEVKSGQTLLDVAEAQGVPLDSGCRSGSCGTCATGLIQGKIGTIAQPAKPVASGICLPCISVPAESVVLDA